MPSLKNSDVLEANQSSKREDDDELVKQFDFSEKIRRQRLRNLTSKQINSLERMSLDPRRQAVRQSRLLQAWADGA